MEPPAGRSPAFRTAMFNTWTTSRLTPKITWDVAGLRAGFPLPHDRQEVWEPGGYGSEVCHEPEHDRPVGHAKPEGIIEDKIERVAGERGGVEPDGKPHHHRVDRMAEQLQPTFPCAAV